MIILKAIIFYQLAVNYRNFGLITWDRHKNVHCGGMAGWNKKRQDAGLEKSILDPLSWNLFFSWRTNAFASFQLLCIEPLMSVRLPPSPSELELQNSRKQVIVTTAPRQTRTSCSERLQVPLIMMWSIWRLFLLSWNAISACGYPCPGKVRVDLMVDGGNPFLLMVNILLPLTVCN